MILYPDIYLKNVKEITVDILNKNNIKGLLLDVDNTLIDFNLNILDGSKEWCNNLKKQGIKICILSNTNKIEKVKRVAKELDLEYINFAKKPFKKGFKKAVNLLDLPAQNIAAVRRPNNDRCTSAEIEWECLPYLQNRLTKRIFLLQK